MIQKTRKYSFLTIVCACIFSAWFVMGAATLSSAKSYRVAYFEAGDYPFYRTLQGEYRERLLDHAPKDVKIIFPPDGYKTAEWDRAECKRMAQELSRNRNIDLIVAMGPWVVEDLLEANCKKPIVAMGRFDPVLEGLAGSNGQPKIKNLTVRISPGKILSDLGAMTAMYPAKRIGLLYFPAGNESAIVESYIRRIAERYNAKLITAPIKPGEDKYLFFKKIDELKGKIDALYMTPLYGMPIDQINGFFQLLKLSAIPAFSSEGLAMVERGAFGTNTAYNVYGLARYHAEKTFDILQGASPQSLPTVFRDARRLTINLGACQELKITPPSSLIAEARLIEAPNDPSARFYSVKEALSEAALVNPSYLADDEALGVAQAQIGEQRSAIFPHLSASGYIRGYSDDPPANSYPRNALGKNGYELTLTQSLFDLSAYKSISLARHDFKTAEALRDIQKSDFQHNVTAAYLHLSRAYELRDAYERNREKTHRGLQVALTHYELKTSERSELVRWEGRKESATVQALSIRSNLEIAKTAFLAQLGRPVREAFVIDRGIYSEDEFDYIRRANKALDNTKLRNAAEDFWVMEATSRSPILNAAHAALNRSATALSVNTGKVLPTISASVGYFQDSYFETQAPLGVDDNGLVITAKLSAPIFDGGKRLKERSKIKARINELGYRLDDATLKVSEQVRRDFKEMVGALDRALFSKRSRTFTAEALEANFDAYEEDANTGDELLRGLQSELTAETDAISARYDFFEAQLKLWRDVGYGYLKRNGSGLKAINKRLQDYQASVN